MEEAREKESTQFLSKKLSPFVNKLWKREKEKDREAGDREKSEMSAPKPLSMDREVCFDRKTYVVDKVEPN